MNRIKIKAIAGIIVVFLLGVIVGVLGSGIFVGHKMRQFAGGGASPLKTVFMRRLDRKLKLTDAQKPEIEKIIDATEIEIREFLQKSHIEFAEIMQRMDAQMKEHLTPAQQEQLEELRGRFQRHWHAPSPEEKS